MNKFSPLQSVTLGKKRNVSGNFWVTNRSFLNKVSLKQRVFPSA